MALAALTSLNAVSRSRRVKMDSLLFQVDAELAQRTDIVQNPKCSTVGHNNQIIIFDYEVVNRRSRQIQFERPPIRSVIERNVDSALGSRIEQSAFLRILA